MQDGDSSVADSIEQLWKREQQTISEKNDQSTSDELENSLHEFSFMLSRVVLPRLIDEFQKMIADISGKSFPLKSPALDTYHQIMKFCQSYGQAHEGMERYMIGWLLNLLSICACDSRYIKCVMYFERFRRSN